MFYSCDIWTPPPHIYLGWVPHSHSPRHNKERREKSRERRGVDWVGGVSSNLFHVLYSLLVISVAFFSDLWFNFLRLIDSWVRVGTIFFRISLYFWFPRQTHIFSLSLSLKYRPHEAELFAKSAQNFYKQFRDKAAFSRSMTVCFKFI